MSRVRIAVVVVSVFLCVSAISASLRGSSASLRGFSASPRDQQQPTFRATTDVVIVDVGVRSNGDPIAGLTAKDFDLSDNGVRQTIDSVQMEDVPVDVSILLDDVMDVADDIKGMTENIGKIVGMVRPTDRVRVMSIGPYVRDLIPAQPAAAIKSFGPWTPKGLSSAFDGLAAALLRPVEPDRRHLIIAITNGVDATSAIDIRALRDIAKRSSATLHIAQVDMDKEINPPNPPIYRTGIERLTAAKRAASNEPIKYFWRPMADNQQEVLEVIADSTGGKLYLPGVFTDRSAAAIFKKVFEDYRRRYVLRYTRTGVPRDGWHAISVTIPAHPNYEINSRAGYAVDPSTPSPGAPPASPPRVTTPRTIAEITDAYGRGDYAAAMAGIAASRTQTELIKDFHELNNPWPGSPNKESAFVIEMAHEVFASRRQADQSPARRLIQDHRRLVRGQFGADAFERLWLFAAVAAAQNTLDNEMTDEFAEYGLTRFPNEPRFVLARAVAKDTEKPFGSLAREAGHVKEVATLYDKAIALDEVTVEARIRKAWLLYRAGGRAPEALALLDAAEAPAGDPFMSYLRQIMRGRVLASLDRVDDALAAFRAAQAIAPAQSSRVGMMAMLLRQGDRTAAETQAARVETMPASAGDPWWGYWLGDYRRFPDIVRRLRELSK